MPTILYEIVFLSLFVIQALFDIRYYSLPPQSEYYKWNFPGKEQLRVNRSQSEHLTVELMKDWGYNDF